MGTLSSFARSKVRMLAVCDPIELGRVLLGLRMPQDLIVVTEKIGKRESDCGRRRGKVDRTLGDGGDFSYTSMILPRRGLTTDVLSIFFALAPSWAHDGSHVELERVQFRLCHARGGYRWFKCRCCRLLKWCGTIIRVAAIRSTPIAIWLIDTLELVLYILTLSHLLVMVLIKKGCLSRRHDLS